MTRSPLFTRSRATRFLAVLTLACFLVPFTTAEARVPWDVPEFSDPLEITNPYMPIEPGAVKVFNGREYGRRIMIVETHLENARTFEWEGGTVDCRVVQEMKFESGRMIGKERMFLAQSDDGSVWCFGEVEDVDDEDDDDEEDEDETGGWIVGQRLASDPFDAVSVAMPTVLMPAQPELRDTWMVENAPPIFVEGATVQSMRSRVRVPAGRFAQCARVRRVYEDGTHGGTEWFAQGVGLVRSAAYRDNFRLAATSLQDKK